MKNELEVIQGGQATRATRELLSPIEAEDNLLISACTDADVFHEARAVLREDHFEGTPRRALWRALCELVDGGGFLSLPTVQEQLRKDGTLSMWTAGSSLLDMMQRTTGISPRMAGALARSIRDGWARRELSFRAMKARSRSENDGAEIGSILADARAELDDLLTEIATDSHLAGGESVVRSARERAERATQRGGVPERPTGFTAIDRYTGGLHVELAILGARPAMGKTALGTAIALNVAASGDLAYIASLETTKETLGMRMLCAEARVEFKRAAEGLLTPVEWRRYDEAGLFMAPLPFVVDDTKSPSVSELWSRVRRARGASKKKLGVVVVDYLQLLRPPRANMRSREQEIAENARALISMAQDLDCPVLALAQLSREPEKREGHRPHLADLRESGELEQAARTVLFIYRKDYYTRKRESHDGRAEVIVAKQNNGPTGTVFLRFTPECARFDNIVECETGDGE